MKELGDKVELTSEDAMSYLEAQVNQAIYDYETNLSQLLKHGQKDRLIGAIMRYPTMIANFTDEGEAMVKAYSALKLCIDAQVAMGIELVDQARKEQKEEINE